MAPAAVRFARAQASTPESATGPDPIDALKSLVALVPGSVANEAVSQGVLFYHADLKAQFDALGVDRTAPDWIEQVPIAQMTIPLALVSPVFQYAMSDELVEAIGFQPLDLDRALETGVPPDNLSLLQGSFDREHLESAWKAAGYASVKLDGDLTMWSKGEDGDLNVQDPVMRIGAGALNNLLLLDDGRTLVISRMGKIVRGVAKQAQSAASGDSMLGMPHVETVIQSLLPATASSIVVSPAMLMPSPQLNVPSAAKEGTPEIVVPGMGGDGPEMPAALMAAFGVEAGVTNTNVSDAGAPATPEALPAGTPADGVKRAQVRLAMASEEDAKQAVDIAAERWKILESPVRMEPYAEVMTLVEASVSTEEATVAAFDFDQGGVGNLWQAVLMNRDLLPFAPGSL
ncbi:MAG: hypothetical protein QM589_07000 [Thermomicrobiales bacterium]